MYQSVELHSEAVSCSNGRGTVQEWSVRKTRKGLTSEAAIARASSANLSSLNTSGVDY